MGFKLDNSIALRPPSRSPPQRLLRWREEFSAIHGAGSDKKILGQKMKSVSSVKIEAQTPKPLGASPGSRSEQLAKPPLV